MSFPFVTLAQGLVEFLPILGHWLAGNDGERIATAAVHMAQAVTGQHEADQILHVLRTNPKCLVEFQQNVLKIGHEMELAVTKDRESARLRDVALAQAGRSNLRADIMVISAALGLVICLITITFFRTTLPGEAIGIISTIAGIFGSCLKDAYAFEFGSSRGSKLKDNKLSAMIFPK